MLVNIHIRGERNVGDHACAPGLYFPEFSRRIEFADIDAPRFPAADAVILGGGAIVPRITERGMKFDVPAVIWGAGHTVRGAREFIPYDLPADRFQLIGLRDHGTPYPWVPCASCLSPLFDRSYPITREYVFYENRPHGTLPIADLGNDCLDLPTVIQTLASAETIVTSSYHGAYWGTLLGRRVMAVPFSSKFYGLRHAPAMIDFADWRQARGRAWPEALSECRAANLAFAEQVWELLGV